MGDDIMKKTIIALLVLTALLSGCGGKNKAADKDKADTPKASQSESANKTKKENKSDDKAPKASSEDKKSENNGTIKNQDGEAVTANDLEKLIDESNNPDIDEETKREILDEIDYILKQAEQKQN